MENAFELKNIIKSYKDFTLGPINLELPKGTVMGYVGNNGAGKSTTILILSGLITQDQGDAIIFGSKIKPETIDWKFKLAYVGEAGGFYESWSVHKNLNFISKFYPNWSNEYMQGLISRLSLDINKKVSQLSTGNRMKLKLVAALSHKPNLLLLDEPSSGLDPVVRAEFADILREYMENENNSILYSTHIISDISRLADVFTFITDGEIVAKENREDLIESWKSIIIKSEKIPKLTQNVVEIEQIDGAYKIITSDFAKTEQEIKSIGLEINSVGILGLDDITLQILKRGKHAKLY